MRSLSCVLVALCLLTGRADADYSKAWQAAKDNLPANTQFVLAIDVATLFKSPLYPKALEMFKGIEREFNEVHALVKNGCGWDPVSVVDGVVLAADPDSDGGVAFIQLTIDRTKASACLDSAMKLMGKGMITVKQQGAYTVASKGTGKHDTVYFPWVGSNVVMVSFKPDHKDKVDAWFNQKGFGQSRVAPVVGKLDLKAAVTAAYAGKTLDLLGVTSGSGALTVAGGKVSATVVATAIDANAATKLAAEFTKELDRDIKKDRTPASVKKIMRAISATATGNTVTIKGTITEKDLGDAFVETLMTKKKGGGDSSNAGQAVAKMEEFSKKMCACKDKACADKVNEELTKWGTEMAKNSGKDDKPSPDLAKKAADVMTRYAECMTKLMMAGNKP